jgi:hypothetical protein
MNNVTISIQVSNAAQIVINNLKQAVAKSPTGVSFIAINGYENSNGEISDNTVNIGASYDNAKKKDIDTLKNVDIIELNAKSDKITLEKARQELINSFINPSKTRSQGQKNAYTIITDGLKVHNETGEVYIYGYCEKKTVKVEGVYPTVNSRPLTIAKKELKKLCNLRTNKFKQYKVKEIGNLKVNGQTLEF